MRMSAVAPEPSPRILELRERVVTLTATERELTEEAARIEGELARVRDELVLTKQQLTDEAKQAMKLEKLPTHAARDAVIRLQGFVMNTLEVELGGDKKRAQAIVNAMLCEKPPTLKESRLGSRKFFEYIGPPPRPSRDRSEIEAERRATAAIRLRDWAVEQEDVFTPGQAAAAVEMPRQDAYDGLMSLVDQGILTNESPTPDMPMFGYSSAPVADLAAERDARARREAAAAAPRTEGAEPVAGTGRKLKVTNKALQSLIDALHKIGATVDPTGGGHLLVQYPGVTKRLLISATPRSDNTVVGERARLRKEGVPV